MRFCLTAFLRNATDMPRYLAVELIFQRPSDGREEWFIE
jgi:hypothetical protein